MTTDVRPLELVPTEPSPDLKVTVVFCDRDATLLLAQAAAAGLSAPEYIRRATVAHVMATWDRPALRQVA